jgi:type VI protein secretion system component VasA
MFAKYYQDELAWLREMGTELAAARPEMARFLAEPGADPDVERLLEGFAFLTGRIRQKLDDEFPEFEAVVPLGQMHAPRRESRGAAARPSPARSSAR